MQDGGSGGCVPGGEGAEAAETWSYHHCGEFLYRVMSVQIWFIVMQEVSREYVIVISILTDIYRCSIRQYLMLS